MVSLVRGTPTAARLKGRHVMVAAKEHAFLASDPKGAANQPTNQPINQPTNQPTNQPAKPTSQPANQPTNQPASQPLTQPTKPTSQPANGLPSSDCKPTNQHLTHTENSTSYMQRVYMQAARVHALKTRMRHFRPTLARFFLFFFGFWVV